YEPVIFKTAKRRGMQDADANELVQSVLFAVARAVDRFEPDTQRARFRTWLYRITHNEFCKQYAASLRNTAAGDSAVQQQLANLAEPSADEMFGSEYRRSVFRWAAKRVKPNVRPSTWEAFYRTAVENEPAEAVAESLGISVGSVYVSRSRVMAKLRIEVAKYEETHDEV
ncbi:MAG: sigma-70 family RNA polymerase sigma factor, partial [Planctomycetales bacterium]|nr:sigma-70 family RNA polymerase sigma factor [Planctomycetales bacterium]